MLGHDWEYREGIYAEDICGSCGCELSKCRQCELIDCQYSIPKEKDICPNGFMSKSDKKIAAVAEEARRRIPKDD